MSDHNIPRLDHNAGTGASGTESEFSYHTADKIFPLSNFGNLVGPEVK